MAIYWFTGQPGAGKTTLANHLVTHLHLKKPVLIDGDDIRKIFSNKDYSEIGRRKNVELAQNLAHFLHDKGHNVCVALVAPYKDQRDSFKEKFGSSLKEVYVHAFTDRGRTQFHVADYQPPSENYVDIDTTNDTEFESYKKLIKQLGL